MAVYQESGAVLITKNLIANETDTVSVYSVYRIVWEMDTNLKTYKYLNEGT